MTVKLGIIGGSGLYDFAEMQEKQWLPRNEGPFGLPSDELLFGRLKNGGSVNIEYDSSKGSIFLSWPCESGENLGPKKSPASVEI